MTWTTTPPTVPGWYWLARADEDPHVVSVRATDGRLVVFGWGIANWPVDHFRPLPRWAGPIPEPAEASR